MIGIALTNICNLKCSYCFAQHIIKENEKIFMTPDDFKQILTFITEDPLFEGEIGLCGGEPTINPYFGEILKIVISDPKIKHIMIYTNGINANRYTELLSNNKINLLINLNPPEEIGQEKYLQIKYFLDNMEDFLKTRLQSIGDKCCLGINISSNDFDYNYAINLCKEYKMKNLRVSITTKIDDPQLEILDYFRSRKDSFLKFIKDCDKENILPGRDCNPIPRCCWTEEELNYLDDFDRRYHLIEQNKWGGYSTCDNPVITILPNFLAINCFALDSISRKSIYDFKHAGELKAYYSHFINAYIRSAYTNNECKNCNHRLNGECGMGCPSMRIESIKAFMKLEKELLNKGELNG